MGIQVGGGAGNPDLTEYMAKTLVEGRLTLTSGTPVTTSDVTAATTLYFTPFNGNTIGLYDGSNWGLYTLGELSLAVPNAATQMYDAFVYPSSGAPAFESLAWTNDTTRATALTTQNGVYVKTGDATRRYVGSFRTTSVAGQTEDSIGRRFVWNCYNRIGRLLQVQDATASWTYGVNAWRPGNNDATNRVELIVGLSEDMVSATLSIWTAINNTEGAFIGIGLDSTSANAAYTTPIQQAVGITDIYSGAYAEYAGFPGIGYHYLQWLENANSGTVSFYGTGSGVGGGLTGACMG